MNRQESKNISQHNKNVINYQNKLEGHNNYCTFRTINEPRDLYNEKIEDYWFLQDRYVHDSARQDVNPVNGWQGQLGCNHQRPTVGQRSGIAYPDHVGVESKLKGI
jgi:hypothetical protein